MKIRVLFLLMIVLSKFVHNDLAALSMNKLNLSKSSITRFRVCVQDYAHILRFFWLLFFESCYQAEILGHVD